MPQTFKQWIFRLGGILLVIGAASTIVSFSLAPYFFSVGSALYCLYYMTTPYEGAVLRNKRLYRFHIYAGVLFVVASGVLFKERSEWIILLMIGVFFELYSTFAWQNESQTPTK